MCTAVCAARNLTQRAALMSSWRLPSSHSSMMIAGPFDWQHSQKTDR
jgi:hypothetical protein